MSNVSSFYVRPVLNLENYINIMAVNGLAPYIAKLSAAMTVSKWSRNVFAFHVSECKNLCFHIEGSYEKQRFLQFF